MSPPRGWRRLIGDRCPDPYRAKTGQPLTDDGPVRGLPLGGLGTGSIGRDHDGRFSRWHLAPGGYRREVSAGSWLGLQVAGEGRPVALVAAGGETRPAGLAPAAGPVGEYEALFPFAWYRHRAAECECLLDDLGNPGGGTPGHLPPSRTHAGSAAPRRQ